MKFNMHQKNIKIVCNYALLNYPNIPKDEWYMKVLYHIDSSPQVSLVHVYDDYTELQIDYPMYNEELKREQMLITDRGLSLWKTI